VQHVELCGAQRALALFQVLGNLHCFDAARCEPDEEGRFAALLAAQLGAGASPGASGFQSCMHAYACSSPFACILTRISALACFQSARHAAADMA
jgi:hypothetical protein